MVFSLNLNLRRIFQSVVLYTRIQRTKQHLEVPLLYREPYIFSGYRVTHKRWHYYLWSLFQVHNETFNVWSHMLAALIFIYYTIYYSYTFDYVNDARTWPLLAFAFGTICYALCSSFAHLFHSMSELAHYTCFQIDYIGISMNALGNSILSYYIISTEGFHSLAGPNFFKLNIPFSIFACVGCGIAKLRYKRPYPIQRKVLQLLAVALQSFYGSIPVLHKMGECALDADCSFSEISPHLTCLLWFLVSTALYSCHIPERFLPGKCDIIGFGHQLFHVVMAYTTCLQFQAAVWELRKRPGGIIELPEPTLYGLCGTVLFVLVMNILFVICTHGERKKRTKIALSDFDGGKTLVQNDEIDFKKSA